MIPDSERFTVEKAKATIKKFGVTLAYNTWGFAIPYYSNATSGCAAALMMLYKTDGVENLQEAIKPGERKEFKRLYADNCGIPYEYFIGLEAGFEHNYLYRKLKDESATFSEDFKAGIEDGDKLREIV